MKTHYFFSLFLCLFMLQQTTWAQSSNDSLRTNPPIYIAFHWHMHQPIYMPYQSVIETHNSNVYSYNLFDVFFSRTGPYTDWPKNAVQKGIDANLANFGAQVSFSGSLVENLNTLENGGQGFVNWKSSWNYITAQKTAKGNPRLDLVAFGYHHPLMGLIDYGDIRKSIQDHKAIFAANFPNYTYSKGIFPPENAFSERMIPALVDEGLQWVMIDNFNFERATENYPISDAAGVLRANKADVINPDPKDWKQLNGLWAPVPVSSAWAHRPHYVQYVDPQTANTYKIIAIPTSRYLGNEDGRGGFGALNYEAVMSQLEEYNTDPNHPILIVLHHDGDNYGGGSEGYYGGNFQEFTNWVKNNSSRFVCTTVQDYLDMFPPSETDVIHVQDGSWVGADSGDPEFKKWNADPGTYMGTPNYSPDRNSWGIVTATNNIVRTANQINPNSNFTTLSWKYYLNSQTSCYWYWDGTEMWDSHPARACNLATAQALNIVATGNDLTEPSIYLPQREPYNPGEIEWEDNFMPTDFKIWTYVFDYSGLNYVKLKYRIDEDGKNEINTIVNETYNGGSGVGEWQEITMEAKTITSITNPIPTYKADEYSAEIKGQKKVLIDYYIEAVDSKGNIAKSTIQHVWVGEGGGAVSSDVYWTPVEPTLNEKVTIHCDYADDQTILHWGVNPDGDTWTLPNSVYFPPNTSPLQTAAQTPFTDEDNDGKFTVVLGSFNNEAQVVNKIAFVIKNGEIWDNNGGKNYIITINNTPGEDPIGADETVTTSVNVDYQFKAEDFYFVGNNGATFDGIKIIETETAGDLEYQINNDVTANTDYTDVTKLIFRPSQDAWGEPYAYFTFKVKDNQGRYSIATYTMKINVFDLKPLSNNASINMLVNDIYTFSEANFPFISNSGATFSGIQIVELNSAGELKYDGNIVTQNQECADLTLLKFEPATTEAGTPYTFFKFKVKDSEGRYSEYSYKMNINVLDNIDNGVSWFPENPTQNDEITVFIKNDPTLLQYTGKLHWGVNGWKMPNIVYQPEGTTPSADVVGTTLIKDNADATVYYLTFRPFNDEAQKVTVLNFVIKYGNNTWNSNGGANWNIPINIVQTTDKNAETKNISVSPNPFKDYTYINVKSEEVTEYTVNLIDITGKIIKTETLETNTKYVLYRNNLTAGVYLLQFINAKEGIISTEKIIIY